MPIKSECLGMRIRLSILRPLDDALSSRIWEALLCYYPSLQMNKLRLCVTKGPLLIEVLELHLLNPHISHQVELPQSFHRVGSEILEIEEASKVILAF